MSQTSPGVIHAWDRPKALKTTEIGNNAQRKLRESL